MNQLHQGARWQFRISAYFVLSIFGIIFGIWIMIPIGGFLLALAGSSANSILAIVLLFILAYVLFIIITGEIYARLAYNNWFYEFTEEGLRLERGIIWKRYSNVPYERVQNVDIHRGIIARMFGFSSLLIQTAGYSAHPYAEGYIPALEMNQAERLREFVMKRITKRR